MADQVSERAANDEQDIILQTGPLIWPVIAVMVIVGICGSAIIGVLFTSPGIVGGPSFAEIIANAVLILVVIILLRYAAKAIVLNRMTYTIYDGGFRLEYELLYRRYSRELPVAELRGTEYERGPLEALFGVGTIRLLTGGTDHSLGFIEFESVRNPETTSEAISQVRNSRLPPHAERRGTVGHSGSRA